MKRRLFLSSAAAIAASASRLHASRAPTVSAESTVFYAADGESSLIRFTVTGIDAPAARLRVYDRRSRLLGTAGVLRTGGTLVGELWLQLQPNEILISALEAPGLRGVHRTTHRVARGPRWTIHWLVISYESEVRRFVDEARPTARTVRRVLTREVNVRLNPARRYSRPELDPLATLEAVQGAGSTDVGIGFNSVAFHGSSTPLDQVEVAVLAGATVSYVVRPWGGGPAYEWWQGLDGSSLLALPLPPGGTLESLGFDDSAATAQRRVDQWLSTSPIHVTPVDARGRDTGERITFVVDTEFENAPSRKLALNEWNARFAYPRFESGLPDDVLGLARQSTTVVPTIRTPWSASEPVGSVEDAIERQRTFALGRARTVNRPSLALGAILANGYRGMEAIAREIRTEFAGTLVFNPAPFPRTDVMDVTGSQQLITDIPAQGYALLLDLGDEPNSPHPGTNDPMAQSARHQIRVDEADGSIASIVDRRSGLEWVGSGMNVLDGARLDRLSQEILPGLGVRVSIERYLPRVGRVQSTILLFDSVPWITIRNEALRDTRILDSRFQFAEPAQEVLWDRGFGHHQAALPTPPFDFARWVWLRGAVNGYFWSTQHHAVVTENGAVVARGASGAGFRLMADRLPATVADAARFGWRTIDLQQHPVRASRAGRLPRFGSLFNLDQPSAAILAIDPVNQFATTVTVYVQDLLGASRTVGLERGLLEFDDAEIVDYAGRPLRQPVQPTANGIGVLVRAFGVTAVRLYGVRLREV